MELNRTQCEKFVKDEDGNPVSIVKKKKHKTMEKAQYEADELNCRFFIKEKLVPYHCRVCNDFHIGRTGDEITQDDVDEIWERTKPDKYRITGLKIIGKIDLNKIALNNKERRRIAKEKRKEKKKLERKNNK